MKEQRKENTLEISAMSSPGGSSFSEKKRDINVGINNERTSINEGFRVADFRV